MRNIITALIILIPISTSVCAQRLKNSSGTTIGYIESGRVKNSRGTTIGYIEDGRVKNGSGTTIGYFDTNRIR
ncbi:MAG: hypothetical protein FJX80_04800, partial [Bacteroidetes bacterium]|nr:hypothetical protein [Bacteroidota bacterium]